VLLASFVVLAPMALCAYLAIGMAADAPFAGTCRFWALALFLAVGLEVSALMLFRPAVLRMVLATPASAGQIHELLDPTRQVLYWVLPYPLGLIAMMPHVEHGRMGWVLGVFYACTLFRLLLPLLTYAAMRLRKLLVPWGHWLVWLTAAAALWGLLRDTPVAGDDLADAPYLLGVEHQLLTWLVAGVLFAVAARWARRWSARAVVRRLRRDELLDLAFGIQAERAPRPRKLLLESICWDERRRRLLFLVQEATWLYRLSDWAKAAAVWLIAFVAALWMMGREVGSASHTMVTLVPLAAVALWAVLRHLRFDKWEMVNPFGQHTLPVGAMELERVRAVLFSGIYFLTALLAWIAVVHFFYQGEDTGPTILAVGAVNAVQLWLMALAAGAIVWLPEGYSLTPAKLLPRCLVRGLFAWLLAMGAFLGLLPAFLRGSSWSYHVPGGMALTWDLLLALCFGTRTWLGVSPGDPFWSLEWGWQFHVLAWAVPILVIALVLPRRLRSIRGRAAPRYGRAAMAGASATPSLWRVFR